MTTYIALLRAINVGGKNIIDMKQLRAAFVDAEFKDVRTYINSGNVLFSSSDDVTKVHDECERLIKERFGLEIAVVVLSVEELEATLEQAPDWWGKDPESRHNTFFAIAPATVEEICAEVGEIKPEYEKCASYGQLIFWSAPIKTFSRTQWVRIPKLTAYQKVTIRNSNTTLKLLELAKQ